MLDRMHRIGVRPGDGILVPSGQVHAIGAGVFIAETQEPTDFSILLEWSVTTQGREDSHLGLGFDRAMAAVSHAALSTSQLASLVRHEPGEPAAPLRPCLPTAADHYFRLHRATSGASVPAGFAVLLVLEGSGRLTGVGHVEIRRGEAWVVPAAYGDWERCRRPHRAGGPTGRRLAARPRGSAMTCFVGLDIGSTWMKALAIDPTGAQIACVRRATPWQSVGGGGTEMSAASVGDHGSRAADCPGSRARGATGPCGRHLRDGRVGSARRRSGCGRGGSAGVVRPARRRRVRGATGRAARCLPLRHRSAGEPAGDGRQAAPPPRRWARPARTDLAERAGVRRVPPRRGPPGGGVAGGPHRSGRPGHGSPRGRLCWRRSEWAPACCRRRLRPARSGVTPTTCRVPCTERC